MAPKYVRLADRLARSVLVDLNSHWSISGLDVKPYPEAKFVSAVEFVNDKLQQGALEGCSKAEYDEVQALSAAGDAEVLEATVTVVDGQVQVSQPQHQEAHLVASSNEARSKLEDARWGEQSDEREFQDDLIRREAIIARQKAIDEGADPDELDEEAEEDEDDDDTAPEPVTPPAPAKPATRKAAASKASAK